MVAKTISIINVYTYIHTHIYIYIYIIYLVESFNIDFIELLLQLADTLLGTEEASKIFGLILACNLHFPVPEENAVLDALAKTKKVDFFFEEMFFLHSIKGN